MIRINRHELDACVSALMACADNARDTNGCPIKFPLDRAKAEAAILGALTIVGPIGSPVTPNDVFFATGIGTDEYQEWPKNLRVQHA